MLERHTLIANWLMGRGWMDVAFEDACRMEHVISAKL